MGDRGGKRGGSGKVGCGGRGMGIGKGEKEGRRGRVNFTWM